MADEEAAAHEPALGLLPEELQQAILERCDCASTLMSAAAVCHLWQALHTAAAQAMLTQARGASEPFSPCPLRSLHSFEQLVKAVGTAPQQSWRTEYASLDMEQDRINGDAHTNFWLYEDGAPCSIDVRLTLKHHADAVRWCMAAGWEKEDAQAYILIFNYGRGAVRLALSEGSRRFAAAAHAIDRGLYRACVRSIGIIAPNTYANLQGAWGLSEVDPAWEILEAIDNETSPASPGKLVFQTKGVAGAERADGNSFPNDRGIHVPLTYPTHTQWECQEGPVVMFLSRSHNSSAMRSLVQTSETGFDLPPLARVTLERVDEAGEWQVLGGVKPKCRLFVVTVEF